MTDLSNEAYIIQVRVCEAAATIESALSAPHVLMRPKIYPDGNQWCALYGENLVEGVAGFGDTPELAMKAFDQSWREHDISGAAREKAL